MRARRPKAASRYPLTSSAVFRCSAGPQGSVSRAISVFLRQLFAADIAVPSALVATTVQHDRPRAAVCEVDAASGPVVDQQRRNARSGGTYLAGGCQREVPNPNVDPM